MAALLSHQVRIPSILGLTGLLALAAMVSSAGLSTASTPTQSAGRPASAGPAASLPAALVTASPTGAVVVAQRFPANAVVRVYAGAPVAGAAYRSLGETRTDGAGTAIVRLESADLGMTGPFSVVVATPDFRVRATAQVE